MLHAVAAYIASGMADVGFGVETGARRFALDFISQASERYFLICRLDRLDSKPIADVLEILRSNRFKARVDKLPGYSAVECGQVMTVDAAFPSFSKGISNSIKPNRGRHKAAVSSIQPVPRKMRQED